MNKRERLPDLLGHILAECIHIETWTRGLSEEQFQDDSKTHYAVARSYENIGEASGKILQIAPDFAELHRHVPFKSYNGMRNILAHQYFRVDLDVLWATVQKIAELKRNIEALRASL